MNVPFFVFGNECDDNSVRHNSLVAVATHSRRMRQEGRGIAQIARLAQDSFRRWTDEDGHIGLPLFCLDLFDCRDLAATRFIVY